MWGDLAVQLTVGGMSSVRNFQQSFPVFKMSAFGALFVSFCLFKNTINSSLSPYQLSLLLISLFSSLLSVLYAYVVLVVFFVDMTSIDSTLVSLVSSARSRSFQTIKTVVNQLEVGGLVNVGSLLSMQLGGTGWSPLGVAVNAGNEDIVAWMIDKGADPNVPCCPEQLLPLGLAFDVEKEEGYDFIMVKELLLAGADVNAARTRGGETLLVGSLKLDRRAVWSSLRALLDFGADLRDTEALFEAVLASSKDPSHVMEVIRMLASYGARVEGPRVVEEAIRLHGMNEPLMRLLEEVGATLPYDFEEREQTFLEELSKTALQRWKGFKISASRVEFAELKPGLLYRGLTTETRSQEWWISVYKLVARAGQLSLLRCMVSTVGVPDDVECHVAIVDAGVDSGLISVLKFFLEELSMCQGDSVALHRVLWSTVRWRDARMTAYLLDVHKAPVLLPPDEGPPPASYWFVGPSLDLLARACPELLSGNARGLAALHEMLIRYSVGDVRRLVQLLEPSVFSDPHRPEHYSTLGTAISLSLGLFRLLADAGDDVRSLRQSNAAFLSAPMMDFIVSRYIKALGGGDESDTRPGFLEVFGPTWNWGVLKLWDSDDIECLVDLVLEQGVSLDGALNVAHRLCDSDGGREVAVSVLERRGAEMGDFGEDDEQLEDLFEGFRIG